MVMKTKIPCHVECHSENLAPKRARNSQNLSDTYGRRRPPKAGNTRDIYSFYHLELASTCRWCCPGPLDGAHSGLVRPVVEQTWWLGAVKSPRFCCNQIPEAGCTIELDLECVICLAGFCLLYLLLFTTNHHEAHG